jgi:hypothetical protein
MLGSSVSQKSQLPKFPAEPEPKRRKAVQAPDDLNVHTSSPIQIPAANRPTATQNGRFTESLNPENATILDPDRSSNALPAFCGC